MSSVAVTKRSLIKTDAGLGFDVRDRRPDGLRTIPLLILSL